MAKSGDFDALLAVYSAGRPGQPLRVDVVLQELDVPTRAKVLAALQDPRNKDRWVSQAMSDLISDSVSEGAVHKWRQRNHVG